MKKRKMAKCHILNICVLLTVLSPNCVDDIYEADSFISENHCLLLFQDEDNIVIFSLVLFVCLFPTSGKPTLCLKR
jgi:hypothetical protein